MENNKKRKKNITIIIVIFIIAITFLLSNYLINQKDISKNIDYVIEESSPDNEYIKKDININKKGKYTGYCSTGAIHYLNINVKFPKLIIDKPNANKLNNIIHNDYKQTIDFISEKNVDINDNKRKTNLFINSTYKYIIKDNIIYLYMSVNYFYRNYFNYYINKNYFYDINNDKILSFEEGIKSAGFSLNDFKKIKKSIKSFKDCEKICTLKIEEDKLIPNIEH